MLERIPRPARINLMEASGGIKHGMPRAGGEVVRITNVRFQKLFFASS